MLETHLPIHPTIIYVINQGYLKKRRYHETIAMTLDVLDNRQQEQPPVIIAFLYGQLAIAYQNVRKHKQALNYAETALSILSAFRLNDEFVVMKSTLEKEKLAPETRYQLFRSRITD